MNNKITKAFMVCSFYKNYNYSVIDYKYKTQSQN